MKDYLGNEINIGDTILYVEKNSRGYRASFTECIVTEIKGNSLVKVKAHTDRRSRNTLNLTALGLRERKNIDERGAD